MQTPTPEQIALAINSAAQRAEPFAVRHVVRELVEILAGVPFDTDGGTLITAALERELAGGRLVRESQPSSTGPEWAYTRVTLPTAMPWVPAHTRAADSSSPSERFELGACPTCGGIGIQRDGCTDDAFHASMAGGNVRSGVATLLAAYPVRGDNAERVIIIDHFSNRVHTLDVSADDVAAIWQQRGFSPVSWVKAAAEVDLDAIKSEQTVENNARADAMPLNVMTRETLDEIARVGFGSTASVIAASLAEHHGRAAMNAATELRRLAQRFEDTRLDDCKTTDSARLAWAVKIAELAATVRDSMGMCARARRIVA